MAQKDTMKEARKGFNNMVSGLAQQLVNLVVGLTIPRLILVYFGSETNGLLNLLTQAFQYIALLEAGVGTVANQALYARISRNDHQGISSCLRATASYYKRTGVMYLICMFLFALIYPGTVQTDLKSSEITWIIIFFGANGALNFFTAGKYKILLQADGRTYILNNIALLVAVVANGIKAALIITGHSFVEAQGWFCMINLIQLAAICHYGRTHYRWLDLKAKPDFQSISQRYSALLHHISALIFGNTDMILLNIMCSLKIVSIYSVYNMISNMVCNLLSQINGSITYRMGQIYQTDKKKFLVVHHMFEVANCVLVFSAFTVMYLFMVPFVTLYTRGVTDVNYIDKKLPLLFALAQLLSCGRIAIGNVITYAGEFRQTQNQAIFESVINLTVSIAGIYYWGIYGALIGTIAALAYRSNDVIWYASKRLLNISPWCTYRRWLVCGILFFAIAFISKNISISADSYVTLMIKASVTGIAVFLIFSIAEAIFEWTAISEWIKFYKNRSME